MKVEDINLDTLLPQKYPFRMIDRVIEYKKGKSLTAIKNITGNEWMAQCTVNSSAHFPETLMIEAAAQTALVFCRLSNTERHEDRIFVLGQVKFEFENVVRIGDQLKVRTGAHKILKDSGFIDIQSFVDKRRILDGQVFYSLINRKKF